MPHLYAVYDRVSEEYGPPFPAKNDGIALRQFEDFRRQNLPSYVLDDFSLCCLSDWDGAFGIQNLLDTPREVALLDSAIPQKVSLEEVR